MNTSPQNLQFRVVRHDTVADQLVEATDLGHQLRNTQHAVASASLDKTLNVWDADFHITASLARLPFVAPSASQFQLNSLYLCDGSPAPSPSYAAIRLNTAVTRTFPLRKGPHPQELNNLEIFHLPVHNQFCLHLR